jgi:hypothetical protein
MGNNYITNSIIWAKLVPMSESMERSAQAQEQGPQGVVFFFFFLTSEQNTNRTTHERIFLIINLYLTD